MMQVGQPLCTLSSCPRLYCQDQQRCERADLSTEQNLLAERSLEALRFAVRVQEQNADEDQFWTRVKSVGIDGLRAIINRREGRVDLPAE